MAHMPTECVSAVAPVDLVPDRICANDDAGAARMVGPRQDGIADDRHAWATSDNHVRPTLGRCLISATNRRLWSSTTSQEKGPSNCVMPSVWTVRRASSSEPMFASSRPSLVMRVHMAIAVAGIGWRVSPLEPD